MKRIAMGMVVGLALMAGQALAQDNVKVIQQEDASSSGRRR